MNFFDYLMPLIGDSEAIEAEKIRIDELIADASAKIRSAITEKTVGSLIWHITSKEIHRMRPSIPVSDFPSYARHLRAIAASTPFTGGEIGDDPNTNKLLV
jgi:hypothetical protein